MRASNTQSSEQTTAAAETIELGNEALRQGRPEEAARYFTRVLQDAPDSPEAHLGLACAAWHSTDGRHLAARHFQRAVTLVPDWVDAYLEYGRFLQSAGRLVDAADCFRRASVVDPAAPGPLLKLGRVLRRLGERDEAIDVLGRACAAAPRDPHGLNLLGIVLAEHGMLPRAIECFQRAIAVDESLAEVWNNLGNATAASCQWGEAVGYLQRALRLRPAYPEACDNLGKTLLAQGRFAEAKSAFARAIELDPGYAEAHVNRARVLLLEGDYRSGWEELQWRRRLMHPAQRLVQRPWSARIHANGQTVVVRAGDDPTEIFMFSRFLPLLERQGVRVVLDAPSCYHDLLAQTPGIARLIDSASPGGQRLHGEHEIELASLPWALRIGDLAEVPAAVPYIYPQVELAARYRAEAARNGRLCIGLTWEIHTPAWTSPPIGPDDLAPLAGVADVAIFHFDAILSEQAVVLERRLPLIDARRVFESRLVAPAERAAALASMDLVIAGDSAWAHLAGAMGVPTYVALSLAPDFAWLGRGETTPWYPSVRLYRQSAPGRWRDVFRQIAADLSEGVLTTLPHDQQHPATATERGVDWARRGLYAEGIASLRYATRLEPDRTSTWNNLGVALLEAGDHRAAKEALEQALALAPDFARAWNNLGNACTSLDEHERAIECFERAIACDAEYPEAHNNLGNALAGRDRDAAIVQYRRALELRPDYAVAMNNLANSLAEQEDHAEAITLYRRALEVRPNYAEAHNNLGTALQVVGESAAALEHLERAIELRASYAEAHNNLGSLLIELEQFDRAVTCFDRAIELRPDYAEAHMNRSLVLLALGDFTRGWPEYEWRWRCKNVAMRGFPHPAWDGRPLDGKRILLYAEQGLGDTIQFIRYAQQLRQQGGTVIFECPRPLVRLISTCRWIDELVPQGEPLPAFDVQLPLLSVPAASRTKLPDVPASIPYLYAEPDLVARWRDRVERHAGFRVGICWQGNPKFASDRHRSIPLRYFEPLAHCEGVVLFSLQKNHGSEQLAETADRFSVVDLGAELDTGPDAFVDTAAIMASLDLVIACDTAIAHLAGALGVETWLALSLAGDWRWLLDRTDSPWYPSITLFRQRRLGDWADVFERMAVALASRTGPDASQAAGAGQLSVAVPLAPGELLDKISILEIKEARIRDEEKLRHVRHELRELGQTSRRQIPQSREVDHLYEQLKDVNEKLWDIEDEIRRLEHDSRFDERFVELARSVYVNNDHRAALKRQINHLLGSEYIEQKEYVQYANKGQGLY